MKINSIKSSSELKDVDSLTYVYPAEEAYQHHFSVYGDLMI